MGVDAVHLGAARIDPVAVGSGWPGWIWGMDGSDGCVFQMKGNDGERGGGGRVETRILLEWVHAETLVHAGSVREEGGHERLEDEAEVEDVVAHSLVDDGVAPGLADDQISPLHHHDGNEERRVAGVLQLLPGIVSLHPSNSKSIQCQVNAKSIPNQFQINSK